MLALLLLAAKFDFLLLLGTLLEQFIDVDPSLFLKFVGNLATFRFENLKVLGEGLAVPIHRNN